MCLGFVILFLVVTFRDYPNLRDSGHPVELIKETPHHFCWFPRSFSRSGAVIKRVSYIRPNDRSDFASGQSGDEISLETCLNSP